MKPGDVVTLKRISCLPMLVTRVDLNPFGGGPKLAWLVWMTPSGALETADMEVSLLDVITSQPEINHLVDNFKSRS